MDRVFLLANTGLYREAGYVGLSRARHRSALHLNDALEDLAHTEDDLHGPPEPSEHLARTHSAAGNAACTGRDVRLL